MTSWQAVRHRWRYTTWTERVVVPALLGAALVLLRLWLEVARVW